MNDLGKFPVGRQGVQAKQGDGVMAALVAALEQARPVLVHALAICDGEGIGPSADDSDAALAAIDSALALASKGVHT
jgi:hypothetical protein